MMEVHSHNGVYTYDFGCGTQTECRHQGHLKRSTTLMCRTCCSLHSCENTYCHNFVNPDTTAVVHTQAHTHAPTHAPTSAPTDAPTHAPTDATTHVDTDCRDYESEVFSCADIQCDDQSSVGHAIAHEKCPKYCGFCRATTDVNMITENKCRDYESDVFSCADIYCHDQSSVGHAIAHEKCAKHCGFCGSKTDAPVINTSTAPDTTRPSLPTTEGTTTARPCVDVEEDSFKCADWKSFGFCDPAVDAGYQVSLVKCRKTCAICSG
ncbi:spore coat protein SP65-like [Mya arenaria]|uniref:spore coat protein SP65-like n=1 Tax=Mya arenaria TaxID=6604 RepID=UPI0022E37614|nr:spore coat protein SP65-like [Mya arenaria]XP_052819179.1 spore coat protein SP65-like [Mya arenaria]